MVSRVLSLFRCFRVLGSSTIPCLVFLYTLSALPAASQSTVSGGLGHTCTVAADGGVVLVGGVVRVGAWCALASGGGPVGRAVCRR